MRSVDDICLDDRVPPWVPVDVRRYIAHTEDGQSIRAIARKAGCHASTVLRQVRRCETRRDDLLIDMGLTRLGLQHAPDGLLDEGTTDMTTAELDSLPDTATLSREAPRILRRLNEPGACLAIAAEMEKAVVVRETSEGETIRTAVVDRAIAEAMALQDWITSSEGGRIQRYRITSTGRVALKRFLAEEEARRAQATADAQPFADQHRDMQDRGTGRRRVRYNAVESPLLTLARRKDKEGKPFLTPDLVAAGERLREDFELAQIGPRVAQNWDRFLTGGGRGDFNPEGATGGSEAARRRVSNALADLGPGLGDVVLRCCCFLEGMESVERRMGWSARSGKIVFRIALTRLKRHYDEATGAWSPLIG
ncbi:helix-turn-helix domain-containing protein [Alphaproteobacteria bacterium GH1-50]|uniref:Helix-turn-helix domain-containing protein n=1 Tax=Kangsaoukella pontilimi TaxID=2691042 RepID=A0A7C9INC1_9RHOB|nr:DUF6456 domain-containing protein [Kangsaoukella pontilimi]MXQ07270.1 helix-turn-helix domain-containing protein [Kangsaoukella pontilimi]